MDFSTQYMLITVHPLPIPLHAQHKQASKKLRQNKTDTEKAV